MWLAAAVSTNGTVVAMSAPHAAVGRWLDHHLELVLAGVADPPVVGQPGWSPPQLPPPEDRSSPADPSTRAVVAALVELAARSDDSELLVRAAQRACSDEHARRIEACGDPAATAALSRNAGLPWAYRRRAVLAMGSSASVTQLLGEPGDLDAWVSVALTAARRLGAAHASSKIVARHPERAALVHHLAQALWAPGATSDGELDRLVYTDVRLSPATVALMPASVFAAACEFRPAADPPSAFDRAAIAVLCAHLGADPATWTTFAALLGDWEGTIGSLCAAPALLDRRAPHD